MEENTVVENKPRKMKELKNGRSRLLPCDYAVLKSIVEARGFTFTSLAKMMDYHETFFNKVKLRGKISETAVRLLKEKFNILPQQYGVVGYVDEGVVEMVKKKDTADVKKKVLEKLGKIDDSENIKAKVTVELSISKDELSELIKSAVLEAFNSL